MNKIGIKKSNIKNNRIYFISSQSDEDIKKIDDYFNNNKKPLFIEKVFKTKSTNKEVINTFINIKLNTDISEEVFKKLAEKFNKILNKSYKMFYTDNNNRFVFIPIDIINNINDSLRFFILDD